MTRTKPPFRADHVGSILRSAAIKDARAKREKGAITPAQLKEVEDREIEKIIRKQEEIGLKLATDGEYRRSWWHFDFFGMLEGVEIYELDHGIQFQGVQTKPRSIRVKGKIGFGHHPMLEHFKFLKAHTKVIAEDDHPEPDRDAFPARAGRRPQERLSGSRRHLRRSRRPPISRRCAPSTTPAAATCSSTIPPGPICAPRRSCKKARDRGLDVDHLQETYTRTINKALEAKPADMVITTHVCRGNFRSTLIASGGYEPVAESLLGKCNYDGYFLEYDTDRAGGFEPLRFLPKGNKVVVLGLVTSKSGTLEKKDDVKRRIDEATKYVALDQLALAAMRLRVDRGGQRARRGRAMGQAQDDRRPLQRGLGLATHSVVSVVSCVIIRVSG